MPLSLVRPRTSEGKRTEFYIVGTYCGAWQEAGTQFCLTLTKSSQTQPGMMAVLIGGLHVLCCVFLEGVAQSCVIVSKFSLQRYSFEGPFLDKAFTALLSHPDRKAIWRTRCVQAVCRGPWVWVCGLAHGAWWSGDGGDPCPAGP